MAVFLCCPMNLVNGTCGANDTAISEISTRGPAVFKRSIGILAVRAGDLLTTKTSELPARVMVCAGVGGRRINTYATQIWSPFGTRFRAQVNFFCNLETSSKFAYSARKC